MPAGNPDKSIWHRIWHPRYTDHEKRIKRFAYEADRSAWRLFKNAFIAIFCGFILFMALTPPLTVAAAIVGFVSLGLWWGWINSSPDKANTKRFILVAAILFAIGLCLLANPVTAVFMTFLAIAAMGTAVVLLNAALMLATFGLLTEVATFLYRQVTDGLKFVWNKLPNKFTAPCEAGFEKTQKFLQRIGFITHANLHRNALLVSGALAITFFALVWGFVPFTTVFAGSLAVLGAAFGVIEGAIWLATLTGWLTTEHGKTYDWRDNPVAKLLGVQNETAAAAKAKSVDMDAEVTARADSSDSGVLSFVMDRRPIRYSDLFAAIPAEDVADGQMQTDGHAYQAPEAPEDYGSTNCGGYPGGSYSH